MLGVLVAVVVPTRIAVAPHIDGHLDDVVWATVPATEAFTQSFPADGATPADPTRLRIAYDDANVYVAFDCDQRAPRVARLTRRDRDVDDDKVAIDLDTAHDRRSAFHFQVSAAGVMLDGLRYADTELATDWDEIWQAEVATTAAGWSVEIRIPLRVVRLHGGVTTWGLQARRWTAATGEIDAWSYAPRDAGGEVSRYGDLGPFVGLAPRQSLALAPFGLIRAVRTDREVPAPYGDGISAAVGLDATWRPSGGIAVSAAVLPDFGQVEADQIAINLTTTEIEYPEKRPFFLHGMDLFQTPIQLLYTRRIGRAPDPPVLPDGVTQTAPAPAATVLGAAKLLATAGPLDLGVLAAVTDGVDVPVAGGATAAVPAAALASHHVVRARIGGDRTAFGLVGTAQLQAAAAGLASHDAFAAGADGAWRSTDGSWLASGQVALTRTRGAPVALLDGSRVTSGDTGVGSELRVAKDGGTLRAELSYSGYTRAFLIDDLGYLDRQNVQRVELDLEAYSAQPHGPMLETRSRIEIYGRRNLDGLVLPSGYQWNISGIGRGLWEAFLELHWRPHYFDDRELGDGRALERSGRLGVELSLRSDPHRAVSASGSLAVRSTHAGSETYVSGQVALRPRDNLELIVAPDIVVARGEPRFLDEPDPSGPRFARLDATSIGATLRGTWTLRRELTIQGYVQALLATLHHRDAFGCDPALRVIGLDDLHPAGFDSAAYDTREGVLDATLVGRWEYAAGAAAYLVYTHAQVPSLAGTAFELRALPRGPAQDLVLAKLVWAWLR